MTCVRIFETRFGWAGFAGRNGKLTRSTLPRASREEALRALNAGLRERAVEDDAAFGDLPGKLRNYFEGERVDFSGVPVDLDGQPEFVTKVLLECREVPYGAVVTYGELARRAGSEKAFRAVGNAMAANPIPIVIPCHRVVASNGRIGGFSAGIDWKRRLLTLEGVDI
jgi:methylated-DNA-[protein]-cysteine S-methyltransferase